MRKSEIILVIVVIFFAFGATAGVLALTDGKPENNSASQQNIDVKEDYGPQADLTAQSEISIDIKGYEYEQTNIKIKKGTKVTWTNQDTMEHNVMHSHEGDEAAHDAPHKDELSPDSLGSQLLKQSESYSFTFNETGDFPYHCSPHPYMIGNITVVE